MKFHFKKRKKHEEFAEEIQSIAKAGFNPISKLKEKKSDPSARIFAERIFSK